MSVSEMHSENQSAFGKVRGKNIVAHFFQIRCI